MPKLYWLQTAVSLKQRMLDKHQLHTLPTVKPEIIEKLKGSAIIEVGQLPISAYPLLQEYAIMFSDIGIETLADFYLASDETILGVIDVGETALQKMRENVTCDITPYVRNR